MVRPEISIDFMLWSADQMKIEQTLHVTVNSLPDNEPALIPPNIAPKRLSVNTFEYISEQFEVDSVHPEQVDALLAAGWRHFGRMFFRYNIGWYDGGTAGVIPLRVRAQEFRPRKDQRRILRKGKERFRVEVVPARVGDQEEYLFHIHKQRFHDNIPESIYSFLSEAPGTIPCEGLQVKVWDESSLVATSFVTVGEEACSSVYGMFDPAYAAWSLGIFTMLVELEWAIEKGKTFYYHGYKYHCPSHYDYKLRFRPLEAFDWMGNWWPVEK